MNKKRQHQDILKYVLLQFFIFALQSMKLHSTSITFLIFVSAATRYEKKCHVKTISTQVALQGVKSASGKKPAIIAFAVPFTGSQWVLWIGFWSDG